MANFKQKLLYGIPLLIAGALAFPNAAHATWTQTSDLVPTGGAAVAPSANPGSIGHGWIDQGGSTWGFTSANTITPSGQTNTSTGLLNVLARASSEALLSQQGSLKFIASDNNYNNVCIATHYTGSGASASFYSVCVDGYNRYYIYKTVAGSTVQLQQGNTNSSLPYNGTLLLTASTVENAAGNAASVSLSVTNTANGNSLGSWSYTDSTPALQTAGAIAVYEYTPTAGQNFPISELTTYSYSAAVTLGITGQPITWSPGNWDTLLAATSDYGVTVDTRQSTNAGADFKFGFTGTTIGYQLDVSQWAAFNSSTYVVNFSCSIDSGPWQTNSLTLGGQSTPYAASQTILSQTLVSGNHTLECQITAVNVTVGTRYSATAGQSPTATVRVNGFIVDNGAQITSYSAPGYALPSKTLYEFGDSILEGHNAANCTDWAPDAFGPMVANGLGAQSGQIGWQGAGMTFTDSYGQVPPLQTAYAAFSAGRPRPMSNVDYVLDVQGTNDSSGVQAAVYNLLIAQRASFGNATWLMVAVPPGAFQKTAIAAGVAQYENAVPTDHRVALIDASDIFPAAGLQNLGTGATQQSCDGLHPYAQVQGQYAAALTLKIKQAIAPGYLYTYH